MLRTESESATQRAYEWARSRILDGTFPGGTLLSEGEVAAAVGVSRTPVREAFLQLASQHMLELYPKRGALVVPISMSDLREVLTARRVVELWAATQVALSADRGVVSQYLRTRNEELKKAPESDYQAFQEADRDFHEYLVAAAGNELLRSFYSSIRDRQIRGGVLAMQHRPSRREDAIAEHVRIIDALESGDVTRTSELVVAHVEATALELGLAPLS